MEALYDSPTNLGTWTTVTAVTREQFASGTDVTVYFEGQLVGPPAELGGILRPVYCVAEPSSSTIQQIGYWDAQENVFADKPKPSDLQNCTIYFRGPVTPAACAVALKWLRRGPARPSTPISASCGPVARPTRFPRMRPPSSIAITSGCCLFYLKWDTTKDSPHTIHENLAWLNGFYNEMAPFGIGEAYQNFLDFSLKNYLWEYYGSNLNQLRMIKGQVDPSNVFHFPQSIPPLFGFCQPPNGGDMVPLSTMTCTDRLPSILETRPRSERCRPLGTRRTKQIEEESSAIAADLGLAPQAL